MLTNTKHSPYAKVSPLDWDAISWTEGLWADVEKTSLGTISHIQNLFESTEISHVVENFHVCAGDHEGEFGGTDFGDGDFYKWLEAYIYSSAKNKDEKAFKEIDGYIDLIARCQLEDGYISTKQIIGERQNNGIKRFNDINDFEVYNFGHLFTTACLYNRITGKKNLLAIAEKAANYLAVMYAENQENGEVQTAVCPSHYMGLVELYRTTGANKYLELAKLTIELRDLVKDGTDDNQDRLPLKKHTKVLGHAVRANYLYAGVSDLYLEQGDSEYKEMLDRVWRNLVDKKIYITGGCGALYNGTSPYGNFFEDSMVHQAYGYEYQLPNVTAYNETCAAIGNVMWAYRMFQIDPKAEYFDIIERTMLNTNLAAMNLTGDKFFYENMLRRTKRLDYELIWPLTRESYISSFCCPPNLARTLIESFEYAYTVSDDSLWIGMYGGNKGKVSLKNGVNFKLEQVTDYPFSGTIALNISEIVGKVAFRINVRVPGWVQKGSLTFNGKIQTLDKNNSSSYVSIVIPANQTEAQLIIDFEMPVRYTIAHPYVEETTNQVAIERGPLVYCLESPDCSLDSLDECMVDISTTFETESLDLCDRGLIGLKGEMLHRKISNYDVSALYQPLQHVTLEKTKVSLVPYFAWDNRGFGEMKIWLPAIYK
ncbi:glycoside hydrolase family 127 protein [Vagococcus sp. BWB3-3]|uniref:Glycoside hydrolase family 127 protein n=1 Tax=Vagococcus allomyrinae TaxID=2794353 RepID=A0A940SVG1_9ENTE|nr:beta-L-arabinofuranosidase domain-containing protein [Vagococcus allomyrinae]MBP1040288.1 glycoside hydrolase family 127 protein [Vagococcus allomyrinae]